MEKARGILVYIQSFEFVFSLHLMLIVLTITNTLSTTLQQKDQDIVNAVNCVRSTRNHLDKVIRDDSEKVLYEVYEFCDEHDISKLEMDEAYIDPTKPRKKKELPTSIIFRLIVSMKFLIGCYKSLIVASMRVHLNCLYVRLHLIHEIHLMISMWIV